jgi:KUP system potassium uptake protein
MRSRTKSHVNRTSVDAKISELEDAEDEDAGLRDERDFKRSQVRAYTTGAKPAY